MLIIIDNLCIPELEEEADLDVVVWQSTLWHLMTNVLSEI